MTVTFVNLTPHEVRIKVGEDEIVVPPSGTIARCAERRIEMPPLGSVPVTRAEYGAVAGLPAPQPDTIYIVSSLVLDTAPDRADIFAPGPAIRDAEGRIVGCAGLSCTPAYKGSGALTAGALNLESVEPEERVWRSTNGRWSVSVRFEAGVKRLPETDFFRARLEALDNRTFILHPGDDWIIVTECDATTVFGDATMYVAPLQSAAYLTVATLPGGAVIRLGGYKWRTVDWVRLVNGIPCTLDNFQRAEAKAEAVRRFAAGEPTGFYEIMHDASDTSVMRCNGRWLLSAPNTPDKELTTPNDVLAAMTAVAPLGEWRPRFR